MGAYLRPIELPAALDALAAGGSGGRAWVVVAGATDHYPSRVGRAVDEDVIDVTAIGGLRGIRAVDGGWRFGALTTWSDIAEADLPRLFDGLRRAARTIGGLQIQNRGTLAGNVCNASPAADGLPNLIALDAEVELASARGIRRVLVRDFVVGNRRTGRAPAELVTALFVPGPLPGSSVRSAFEKLGSRAYLVISIAMVAAVLEVDHDRRITRARIAVGACSEVALRLPMLEAELQGTPAGAAAAIPRAEHLAPLTPIDDVRGTAAYRRHAALVLVRRALEAVAS